MSMLAGPRRKQKLSADPRGNAWSKDESKFGQKLLEKFGWAKGKGLGANEDGNVDHVKISVKNDTRGVGCSRNHADNWIAHQDDFNDLLSSLNENAPEKDTNDEKDTDQVTGLEKKSKASRSRVHYQKFTKGKDLSSRSREDMACIFGRRKVKQDADLTPSSEDDESSSDNQGKAEHGVVTVRSTDSVQDYFAKKMAEKKASMASQNTDDKSEDEMRPGFGKNTDTINNADEEKITAKKKVRFSLGEEVEVDVDMSKTKKKKSKKNRKSKDNEESIGEITKDNTEDVGQGESEDSSNNEDSDKSNRKRKRSSESQVDEDAQVVNSKKRKKSKKRKTKTGEDHEMSVESDEANFSSVKTSDQHETKISKRKQEKLLTQTQVESDEESQVQKSKKMKKSKKAVHFLTEPKCSPVQDSTADTQDSGKGDPACGQLVNDIESVKIETNLPNEIQSKLEKIHKARQQYVRTQKKSDSGKLMESKTDKSMSNQTRKNDPTQKSGNSQELIESKIDVSLSRGQKRRGKKRGRKVSNKPGGYLGYCTEPSDWTLNRESKKVVNKVKKSGQAFSGSNCTKVIGYGEDSAVVLANKIVEKEIKHAAWKKNSF